MLIKMMSFACDLGFFFSLSDIFSGNKHGLKLSAEPEAHPENRDPVSDFRGENDSSAVNRGWRYGSGGPGELRWVKYRDLTVGDCPS